MKIASLLLLLMTIWFGACSDSDNESAWKAAQAVNSEQSYLSFVDKYPKSRHIEDAIWKITLLKDSHTAYESFMVSYPKSKYNDEALWKIVKYENTTKAYQRYMYAYPNGAYTEDAYYNFYDVQGTKASYEAYLEKKPQGKYAPNAKWEIAKMENTIGGYLNIVRNVGGEFAQMAKDKLHEIHKKNIREALDGISAKIVNRCFGGGQDVGYSYDDDSFDDADWTYNMKLKVEWNGSFMRENHYWISGDFRMTPSGGAYKLDVSKGWVNRSYDYCSSTITN